jgi:hypothetical protein
VALLYPIEFPDREKLEILQRLDHYRKWRSLDEKRYCLACSKVIEGHHIQIVGGTRGSGPLRSICPTRGCHSIPMDWVLPTDEMLARMSILVEEPRAELAKFRNVTRENFAARLRKFATQFRPAP